MQNLIVLGELVPASLPQLTEVLQSMGGLHSSLCHNDARSTHRRGACDMVLGGGECGRSRAVYPVLSSYPKLVAELLAKGVLIYMLNVFCNSNNSDNRQAAAAVFSKMIADKVMAWQHAP